MVFRSGVDGCGKFHTHRDSIPEPSTSSELLYRLRHSDNFLFRKLYDVSCPAKEMLAYQASFLTYF